MTFLCLLPPQLATQKIQEQTRMSKVKKMRRPSSPVTQVSATAGRKNKIRQVYLSPSPSRQVHPCVLLVFSQTGKKTRIGVSLSLCFFSSSFTRNS